MGQLKFSAEAQECHELKTHLQLLTRWLNQGKDMHWLLKAASRPRPGTFVQAKAGQGKSMFAEDDKRASGHMKGPFSGRWRANWEVDPARKAAG